MRPFVALRSPALALALLWPSLVPAGAASAVSSAPVVLAQFNDDDSNGGADPQSTTAALSVRVDRLENTIRSLTGQIEQLQFQNRKLSDDLRKMQEDVDFRFQDLNRGSGGGAPKPATPTPSQKRTDLDVPVTGGAPAMDASGADPTPANPSARPVRKVGDAFDPAADPNAPGAPRPLGSTVPSAPLATKPGPSTGVTLNTAPSAPLDLMKRPTPVARADDESTENGVAAVIPSTAPPAAGASTPVAPAPNVIASLAPGGTRDEFGADLDLYKQGQYDGAATGLRSFLDKYPRDRLVPDAVYLLGQTYTKLGRHREAAEQYLRLSTDFSKAPRAPDAMLRLGMSLDAMGVHEQACATYQEVTRRYPAASPDVRASVDRELKRARC